MAKYRRPSLDIVSVWAGAETFLICETEQRYPQGVHQMNTRPRLAPSVSFQSTPSYLSPESLSTG